MTDQTTSEPADLVDEFYAGLVRPLGNLVILYAQAEAALLELWGALDGCTEEDAQKLLSEPSKVQQQRIIDGAKKAGIPGQVEELSEEIGKYYLDRDKRNRLIHDEWYVSLLHQSAEVGTRGLPRKSANVVWDDPKPGDVWELAGRFRHYRSLFTTLSRMLRDRRGG